MLATGGTIACEPSEDGLVPRLSGRAMLERLGEDQLALMRGIKRVFDPNNILNPNKVCEVD